MARELRAVPIAVVPPHPPAPPPLAAPPIQTLNPGSIAGRGQEAGGVWAGRKQCARPAGSGVAGRESARASEGPPCPSPAPAFAAPPSKYYTLARLQGKARRLVGCGSGGNRACPAGGSGVAGRGSARAREGPPCPSPPPPPCRPPIQILHPGSIAGQGQEASGVWVGRKQCCPAGGSGVAGRGSARAREGARPAPPPRAALAAPPSKYYTLARLQGKARRLVGCGSGGNSARGWRGAGLQGGRARERAGSALPPPPLPPCRPPHPNTTPWLDCRARPGGWWCVGRAETVRAAGGERGCREGERASERGVRPAPPPRAALAAPPSKYYTLARLQGKARRLVGCGPGGNSARGRRERSCREGERASERGGRPAPPPRAALAAPPSKYYTLARLQGKARRPVGCGSGGNSACAAGGERGGQRERERERRESFSPIPRTVQ